MGCCGNHNSTQVENFSVPNRPQQTQSIYQDDIRTVPTTIHIQKVKTEKEIFIESASKMHNEYRAKHSAPPLIINEEINKIAQQYAEHLASIDTMAHSTNHLNGERLGENLYWYCGTQIDGAEMTTSWYDEIAEYDFNNPGFQKGTSHFTQVIWKDSKEVGFGYAQSATGAYFGVANYLPGGNIDTSENFRKNVLQS